MMKEVDKTSDKKCVFCGSTTDLLILNSSWECDGAICKKCDETADKIGVRFSEEKQIEHYRMCLAESDEKNNTNCVETAIGMGYEDLEEYTMKILVCDMWIDVKTIEADAWLDAITKDKDKDLIQK